MSDLRLTLPVPDRLNPHKVRVRVFGSKETPWFCLADVCEVIGIDNPRNVAARLADAEKITVRWVDGNRGNPSVTFVSEAAFYKVVLRSRAPAADQFTDWVTGEVLPSIRRHGCYPPPAARAPNILPYTNRVLQFGPLERVIPQGHWCVFNESADVLLRAERVLAPAGLTLDHDDLLDGSIGLRWSKFRIGKPWAVTPVSFDYQFPSQSRRSRITVKPRAYQFSELGYFKDWLRRTYLPVYFPAYLESKYGCAGYQKALPHIHREIPAALPSAG